MPWNYNFLDLPSADTDSNVSLFEGSTSTTADNVVAWRERRIDEEIAKGFLSSSALSGDGGHLQIWTLLDSQLLLSSCCRSIDLWPALSWRRLPLAYLLFDICCEGAGQSTIRSASTSCSGETVRQRKAHKRPWCSSGIGQAIVH